MKNYGWDYLSGADDTLGYRMDNMPMPKKVPIKGDILPGQPEKTDFYIYTGDEKGYIQKSFDEWIYSDLEKFFNKSSNIPDADVSEAGFIERLIFPKTYAHNGVDHSTGVEHSNETEEQRLTRINNLLGNVVIFVQNDPPTEQQIKDKFNNLTPLSNSTCGG